MAEEYAGYYSRRFLLEGQNARTLSTAQLYDRALGELVIAVQNTQASAEAIENEYRNVSLVGAIALKHGIQNKSGYNQLVTVKHFAHAYATKRLETLGPVHAARIGGHYDALKAAADIGSDGVRSTVAAMHEATKLLSGRIRCRMPRWRTGYGWLLW